MPVPIQPGSFSGIEPVRGFNRPEPEATPEQIHGGPADPFHNQFGEASQPYSWQSQLTNYSGHTGPYGPESELLDDGTLYEGAPAGQLGHDPYGDLTPGRGHAAPMPVRLSGPLPSQHDSINNGLVQSAEIHATNLGASRKRTMDQLGDAQQDHWSEIWDVSNEPEKYPANPRWNGFTAFGFGTNDRPSNPMRKMNAFGYEDGHHHRRFATGSIPGNYMWMRPGSRPMIKTVAGPARPANGQDSPFEGDDLTASFGIQGAVLVEVPAEYQPPPSPQLGAPANYDTPTPSIPLW